MIEIFEGRIGGGKSYTAVERIAEHLAKGGTVYTNIEWNWPQMAELIARRFYVNALEDQLRNLPENIFGWHKEIKWGVPELPVLVLIDEAHLWYNARDWKATETGHKDMLSFLTQSRKACVNVIFITQAATNLEKQFRILAQFTWSLRDMQHVKFGGLGNVMSNYIFSIKRDYTGEKLGSAFTKKSKYVFNAYKTLSFLDPAMKKESIEKRENQIEPRQIEKIKLSLKIAYVLGFK